MVPLKDTVTVCAPAGSDAGSAACSANAPDASVDPVPSATGSECTTTAKPAASAARPFAVTVTDPPGRRSPEIVTEPCTAAGSATVTGVAAETVDPIALCAVTVSEYAPGATPSKANDVLRASTSDERPAPSDTV